MDVVVKRVYEPAAAEDGARVLVDRLWPRGVSKAKARLDAWLKDVAPSDELRKWFAHDPAKWSAFRRKYLAELARNPEAVAAVRRAGEGAARLTLLYAARDAEHNEAVVLRDYLVKKA